MKASGKLSQKKAKAKKAGATHLKAKRKPILTCLIELSDMGLDIVNRHKLSSLTGYQKNSISTMLSLLKKKGHVLYDKNTVRITPEGRAAVAAAAAPVPYYIVEAHASIKDRLKLKGKEREIYDQLSDGEPMDQDALMVAVGCKNKTSFCTHLSSLRAAGVLQHVDGGPSGNERVRLGPGCFPYGRR